MGWTGTSPGVSSSLNLQVPSTAWIAAPRLRQGPPLPGGGTTDSWFQQREGLTVHLPPLSFHKEPENSACLAAASEPTHKIMMLMFQVRLDSPLFLAPEYRNRFPRGQPLGRGTEQPARATLPSGGFPFAQKHNCRHPGACAVELHPQSAICMLLRGSPHCQGGDPDTVLQPQVSGSS